MRGDQPGRDWPADRRVKPSGSAPPHSQYWRGEGVTMTQDGIVKKEMRR